MVTESGGVLCPNRLPEELMVVDVGVSLTGTCRLSSTSLPRKFRE